MSTMSLRVVGVAADGARCDCERENCSHRAGNCSCDAVYLVEAWGIKYRSCQRCFSKTRAEAHARGEDVTAPPGLNVPEGTEL
jgi:hypothetical protein